MTSHDVNFRKCADVIIIGELVTSILMLNNVNECKFSLEQYNTIKMRGQPLSHELSIKFYWHFCKCRFLSDFVGFR